MLAIIKKELKSYFLSPIGYVFIGLFLTLVSLAFCFTVFLNGIIEIQYMFRPVAVMIVIIIPMLTMRTFAEERKNQTEILLFTSPRSVTSIVLAKFFAATIVLAITAVFTFMYYFILNFFGSPDITVMITSLLGVLLLGMAYTALGIFASSITENQIIAAIVTIVFIFVASYAPYFSKMFEPFALINVFDKFLVGVISIANIFTYITFIAMFILLTIIFLQRRKSR